MARYRRTARINEQLREEISLLIREEVRDPRVGLATITAVETSPELDHARVYVNTMGDEAEKAAAVAGLQSAAPFIRGQLGKRLHIRRVPELHFEIDRKLERAMRIESLLREALGNSGDTRIDEEDDVGPGAEETDRGTGAEEAGE